MTEKTQQQKLEEDFDQAILQTTPKGGRKLTYVPVHEVIARLNNVLGTPGWEWKNVRIWRDQLDPHWVLATGELTCTIDGKTATKAGSGGVEVSRTKADNTIVDLGDEFKGAESDALKKAAQRFGVALGLSRKPEAIAYEMKQAVEEQNAAAAEQAQRQAQDEGWRSPQHRDETLNDLKGRIGAQGDNVRKAMNEAFRQTVKTSGRPTAAEYATLEARFQELVSPKPQPDRSEYEADPYELPGPSTPYKPQQTPPAPASAPEPAPEPQVPAEAMSDHVREAAASVAQAFPGTEDVTPAKPEYLAEYRDRLQAFDRNEDVASRRAVSKYRKEKAIPENTALWTQAQVSLLLDFIDEL